MADEAPHPLSYTIGDPPKRFLRTAPTCECHFICIKTKSENSDEEYWGCPKSDCAGLNIKYFVPLDDIIIVDEDTPVVPKTRSRKFGKRTGQENPKPTSLPKTHQTSISAPLPVLKPSAPIDNHNKRTSEEHGPNVDEEPAPTNIHKKRTFEEHVSENRFFLENYQSMFVEYAKVISGHQIILTRFSHLTVDNENLTQYQEALRVINQLADQYSDLFSKCFIPNKKPRED